MFNDGLGIIPEPAGKRGKGIFHGIGDKDSPPMFHPYLSHGLQDTNRFANGRTAHIEFGGKLVFGVEFVPRIKTILDDHLFYCVDNLFGKPDLRYRFHGAPPLIYSYTHQTS